MNLVDWLDEVRTHLDHLNSGNHLYLFGANKILPPEDNAQLLEQLVSECHLPLEFEEFYSLCGGLALSDVWNGYWVYGVENISERRQKGDIRRMIDVSLSTEDVLVFGGNSGGGSFAIEIAGLNQILYLPSGGSVESTVWSANSEYYNPIVVSHSFAGFLERLLADLKAFVNKTPHWVYMPDR